MPCHSSKYRFKLATEPMEFQQIATMNYRAFVEEIPQHSACSSRSLIDRFHDQNTYAICLRDAEVVGMIAARGQRPFSLDQKIRDLDRYLPLTRPLCEIRLLTIRYDVRGGRLFAGLLRTIVSHCVDRGYKLAVISGTTRQLRLYRHLGFVPFAGLVGMANAQFQPMYLTLEKLETRVARLVPWLRTRSHHTRRRSTGHVSFLPGPVDVSAEVRAAFHAPPISHRDEQFVHALKQTKRALRELTGAQHSQILCGSGTLANDAVAAQLRQLGGNGLVLSNGEFGDRLIDHARRFELRFDVLRADWGKAFAVDEVARVMNRFPELTWVWCVHCETSSGVLNDLPELVRLCASRNIRLCVDCVSSLGAVPVDLRGVYLASASSGKALAAFAGLAIVFHSHPISPNPALPRYLDLGVYQSTRGVPFTMPAPSVFALQAALRQEDHAEQFDHVTSLARLLRAGLRDLGLSPLAADEESSPAVTTLLLSDRGRARDVGRDCAAAGIRIAWESQYLRTRNAIQICLMGCCEQRKVLRLLRVLRDIPGLARTESRTLSIPSGG